MPIPHRVGSGVPGSGGATCSADSSGTGGTGDTYQDVGASLKFSLPLALAALAADL